MRPPALFILLGAGLLATSPGRAQVPRRWEVRAYIDCPTGPINGYNPANPLTNYYPGAPTVTTESTVKEPWVCGYCGYSTGGSFPTTDLNTNGNPDWDDNANGIPDEAEGFCPNPWNAPGHPGNVPLQPMPPTDRLLQFNWLNVGGPLFTLVRGMPLRPNDPVAFPPGQAVVPNPPNAWRTNWFARVRPQLAFAAGQPQFAAGRPARFLLIPPGVNRPTARYHRLGWVISSGVQVQGGDLGVSTWIGGPGPNKLFIGVDPWRATDGDYYQVRVWARVDYADLTDDSGTGPPDGDYEDYYADPNPGSCRWERDFQEVQVQVWSRANGVEAVRVYNQVTANPQYNLTLLLDPGPGLPAGGGNRPYYAPRMPVDYSQFPLPPAAPPLLGTADVDPNPNVDVVCTSGAVRLSVPIRELRPAAEPLSPQVQTNIRMWWALGFTLCNNARILPDFDGPPGGTIDWYDQDPGSRADDRPDVPALGGFAATASPQNYFTMGAGVVADTGELGAAGSGDYLAPAEAREFFLRPGEVGTGMVAMLWRPAASRMWTYDEDTAPEPTALALQSPDPVAYAIDRHANAVQPVAARFSSTRVEVPRPDLAAITDLVQVTTPEYALPPAVPGGPSRTEAVDVQSRQVGSVLRCPRFLATQDGRLEPGQLSFQDAGGVNEFYLGRGSGGDPAWLYDNASAPPNRTIGCGAVHVVGGPCWCGRLTPEGRVNTGNVIEGHDPEYPESMHCNYCGTLLRAAGAERAVPRARVDDQPPNSTVAQDLNPGEVRVDVAPALQANGHEGLSIQPMAAETSRRPQEGVPAPEGRPDPAGPNESILTAVLAPLFADLPQFQVTTFAPGPGGQFHNGLDSPYQGALVAYHADDEENPWDETLDGTAHFPGRRVASDPTRSIYDRNGAWDAYHLCPDCGNKTPDLGPCNHPDCPGHQFCPRCGAGFEPMGESANNERGLMLLSHCPFCPRARMLAQLDVDGDFAFNPGPNPDDDREIWVLLPSELVTQQPNILVPDALTAEEFDPVVVATSVLRKTRLAAEGATVDLGRTAPGVTTAGGFPVGTSQVAFGPAASESNYLVVPVTQGASAASEQANAWTVATSVNETLTLLRDDVDPSSENRSPVRLARSMPLTTARLSASVPGVLAGWAADFAPGYRGAAGAQAATALLQAGTVAAPVPNAIGSGSYSGVVLAYVDTDGNQQFDFLDRSQGLTPQTTAVAAYDPAEDHPLEPVVALRTRLRVVEGPIPFNDQEASDASPAPLFLDSDGDGLHDSLEVLWETNRLPAGGTPNPDAAVNIAEGQASVAGGPGVARDYAWAAPPPVAVTTDTGAAAARTVNGTPEAYLDLSDPANPRKWAFWHKATPSPMTDAGVMSQLWFSAAPANIGTPFGQPPPATNFVFDSSLDKSFIRGFVNPGAAAPANHWAFWNSGRRGQEEIHYCPDYNPTDPATARDLVLPVANGVAASARVDGVLVNGLPALKPSKSPFTYAKDPAPVLEADPATGNLQVHLFFSAFVPQDGNTDLCYVRFNAAEMQDRDLNYGKVPQPRIDNPVAGWGGEELRADGLRQTFGARHLDWLTTRRPARDAASPDFVAAPSLGNDPSLFLHLVTRPAGSPAPLHTPLAITWTEGRYQRASGTYRLGGLSFAGAPAPLDPRGGRPLEMEVDPAAGLVRFSAALFNATAPGDPAALFNTGSTANLVDVQLWASYTPYVYRLCRDDAGDDSPSAFFDYGSPGLAGPGGITPAERASVGRFVVFWRRAHGASEPPHFGRTSFMYTTYTSALQVGHPPLNATPTVTDVTAGGPVAVVGAVLDDGLVGLAAVPNRAGHRVRVDYAMRGGGNFSEYHTVVGWSREQRANVDTVISEGPLVVRREWYGLPVSGSQLYMARYWLFWTSTRTWFRPTDDQLYQSRDVYYASVVPEFGTALPERNLPSQ